MKKPGKARISEDWRRYIDVVRGETSRGLNEKQANDHKEIEK